MADDQKKDAARKNQQAPSAAQEAQSKVYNALPEQIAIRLKKNGAIAQIALLGGDEIDASAITDAQYLQIANDLIKNRTAKFEVKSPKGAAFEAELSIEDLDKRLAILSKDPATKTKYDEIINELGAKSFNQAIPDEARRLKIAKAVGDSVEENTGNLPFLGGASFMNALMGFLKWMFSGFDGTLASAITKETANGIAASTEKNLAGANIGLSSETIKEISTSVRARILKEKGVADKDAPEPETLATTKGAEPKKEAPKEAAPVVKEPEKTIAAPEIETPSSEAPKLKTPSISPPPPPPIPQEANPSSKIPAAAGAAGIAGAFLKHLEEQEKTQAPASGNGKGNTEIVYNAPIEKRTDTKPIETYDPSKPPVLPDHLTLPSKQVPASTQPATPAPSERTTPAVKPAETAIIKTPSIVTKHVAGDKIKTEAPSSVKHEENKTTTKTAAKEDPKLKQAVASNTPAAPAAPQPATTAPATPSQTPPTIQLQKPAPVPTQPSHLERVIGNIATQLLADKDIPNKPEVIRNLTTFLANNAKDIDLNNPKKGIEKVTEKLFDQKSNDQSAIKTAKAINDNNKLTPEYLIKQGLQAKLTTALRENKGSLEKAIAMDDAAQKAGKEWQQAGISTGVPLPQQHLSVARPQGSEQQLATR